MTAGGRIVMALKLSDRCPHCDEDLTILLRRRFPDGQLEAAVQHGFMTPSENRWRPVYGFDDLPRLEAGT